jgi:DNA mismatch endonuclease (patch repair protein)
MGDQQSELGCSRDAVERFVRKKSRSTPRFRGLSPRNAATSRVGAANRKKNTGPELLLRRELSAAGLRFGLHAKDLPGCPDLVFRAQRIVIFCDGDFWHGRAWPNRKMKLAAGWNADYWLKKIDRNRQRDRAVTAALRRLGWRVIRVWEGEVRRDPLRVVIRIRKLIAPD